jgi:hypothetical protein
MTLLSAEPTAYPRGYVDQRDAGELVYGATV